MAALPPAGWGWGASGGEEIAETFPPLLPSLPLAWSEEDEEDEEDGEDDEEEEEEEESRGMTSTAQDGSSFTNPSPHLLLRLGRLIRLFAVHPRRPQQHSATVTHGTGAFAAREPITRARARNDASFPPG